MLMMMMKKLRLTSVVDDVQRAVDDVVEFESVICIREALEIKGVVLDK